MRLQAYMMIGALALLLIAAVGCAQTTGGDIPLRPELWQPAAIKSNSTALIAKCYSASDGRFYLGKRLNRAITNNQEARDALKPYWYSCQETPGGEDCIDFSNPDVVQNVQITLENNATISAWMLGDNYAVDASGDLYQCWLPFELNRSREMTPTRTPPRGQPAGFGNCTDDRRNQNCSQAGERPVCGIYADGSKKEFLNSCLACDDTGVVRFYGDTCANLI
jgi:hypothetical protein